MVFGDVCIHMKSLKDRFWEKVNKTNECWEWIAGKSHGYGVFWINGKLLRAHRVAWSIYNGGIPEGLLVLHKCDNPACVNPDHLFIGTQQDNVDDMITKR